MVGGDLSVKIVTVHRSVYTDGCAHNAYHVVGVRCVPTGFSAHDACRVVGVQSVLTGFSAHIAVCAIQMVIY